MGKPSTTQLNFVLNDLDLSNLSVNPILSALYLI